MQVFRWTCLLLVLLAGKDAAHVVAAEPIAPGDFARLHALVKPQPDESRWTQIEWLTDVWEARRRAAEQGKLIFVWAGSGGGPVGVC